MKIAIIGGRMRGVEVAVLARSAGIHAVLIDKDRATPASGLCSESYVFDVEEKEPALLAVLKNVDVVIPAMEGKEALAAIESMCIEINIKVAFDFIAYSVTASKIQADLLISEENIPHLKYYPHAEPPYVLKPVMGNRRRSLKQVETKTELEILQRQRYSPESWIAQEHVDGPAYSVEVIGTQGDYKSYEVTKMSFAPDLDCNMISSPADITEDEKAQISKIAINLAEKIQLTGIMTLEALKDEGQLKVIEMCSVFPSQTPITIFYSTGINLLVELLKVYASEDKQDFLSSIVNEEYENKKHVVYKNFQFLNKAPTFGGEGTMYDAGPLRIMVDFFGSDYAITDYIDDDHEWQAIFINIADTADALIQKRINSRELLFQHCRKQL